MLRFLQHHGRPLCDRVRRRELLRVGGLAALGLTLPQLCRSRAVLAATQPATPTSAADACILIYLFGGPSQIDTFDLKPEAPVDFRGEFTPIDTCVPGIQVCEHLPYLARQMDKLAIVRSMHHEHPRHGYGLYYMFTGQEHPRPDLDAAPAANDFPSLPALASYLRGVRGAFPLAVTLPRWNRFLDVPNDYAGETAGFLGKTYDPWLIRAEPNTAQFEVGGLALPRGVTFDRLAQRRDLLADLDCRLAELAAGEWQIAHDALTEQALALVTSPQARRAFRLEDETPACREQYGASPFGQGLLLARRLVEAGATCVTVNWHDDGRDVKSPFWDTHRDNFQTLRDVLLPPFDRGLSALLSDLADRGLLHRTLVVVMGEFGRTPRVGRVVMNAATNATGRDHWPHAYSVLLAGAGVRGGQVYGASDERAAYVAEAPVRPPDLVATVLERLGCDLHARLVDRSGRPLAVTHGQPIRALYG